MNIESLIKNISDQVVESQIKLGYANESIRLYYPPDSINSLLETDISKEQELIEILNEIKVEEYNLGKLKFDSHKGRIEVSVPPKGVEYIYKNVIRPQFLVDIIGLFQYNHNLDIEEIKSLFDKYSERYICKKMPDSSDFDYVLYFDDTSIDEYYYCIKMEMGHTIYHRFTKADYERLLE